MSSLLSLQEENRILQQELSRVEDLLAQSRAERDELAIKYNAISERLEQSLRTEAGEREAAESRSLAQHNIELRRLLEEEQAAYKRKLQAYQEGQQRQAQLVQKLQAKVLQYKKKCGEVEQQLLEKATELEQERLTIQLDASGSQPEEESSNELENALIRLEEEQQRSSSLVQVNSMLREQLEQANAANAALSEDIRKLTADWARSRDELEQREAEWRREEESFNAYFSTEHSRLLTLWRQVVALRRHFGDMKSSTERDLSELGHEMSRAGRAAHAACLALGANLRLAESQAGAARERRELRLAQLEEQLAARARDADLEKSALGAKLEEMTAALERRRGEDEERERAVQALTLQLRELEAARAREPPPEEVQALRSELELLRHTLHDVTQVLGTARPCLVSLFP
ncbi:rootletin [Corapipo altera]|uniref:rootletin n=1 Tax=Corapipo altera TaxID=415028 RepID=UPI000FD67E2D|nr:rootletin [Corapipo altera]